MELPATAYNGEDDQGVACVSLFRAVLDRALDDALLTDSPPAHKAIKERAVRWLEGTSSDYYFICQMAMLNPKWVKEQSDAYLTARRTGVELGKYERIENFGDETG